MKLKRSHYLTVQSAYRSTGTPSRYSLVIPDLLIEADANDEVVKLTVTDFAVANSWYQVNSGKNTIQFQRLDTQATTNVAVPPGTYNYFDLAKLISTLYPAATVRYHNAQNTMTFTFTTQHRLMCVNGIAQVLGFTPGTVYTGTTITSETVCDPLPIRHINLSLTNLPPLDCNVNLLTTTTGIAPCYTLASIPVGSVAPFHLVTWINDMERGVFTGDNKMVSLDFELTDQYGTEITFIPDHQFTLKIEVFDTRGEDNLMQTLGQIRETLRDLLLTKFLRTK